MMRTIIFLNCVVQNLFKQLPNSYLLKSFFAFHFFHRHFRPRAKKQMGKQPYIPVYIGDYIQDTRMLPLNVRGGWIEIILQSWKTDGVITGTIEEFARMMSCDIDEASLVIQTLNQKKIFGYADLGNGLMEITCRKIVKIKTLSKTRKKTGGLGGNPALLIQKVNQPVNQDDNQSLEYNNSIQHSIVKQHSTSKLTSTSIMKKPSVDEIKAYCLERKNTVDAEKFFNHYESNGWRVGKNPMRSWTAAVRTWEKNNYDSTGTKPDTATPGRLRIASDFSGSL